MDIKEKMNLCLSDELLENTVLSENEKKVLDALLYSYKVCSKSHDGEIIRSMSQLREDSQIKQNKMYEALRNLELLYHMVERTSGESRVQGKTAKASVFKLNFEAIFNPPKTPVKFNFFEDIKSSETPMGTANTNANANIKANINTKEKMNNNSNNNSIPVVPSTGSNKVKENISKIISNMNNFISDIREFNADCTKAVENGKAAIKYYGKHKTSASVKQRAIIEEQIENFQKALKDRKRYIGNNLSEEERKKLDPATEEYQISIGHKVVWNYNKALQFAESIAAGEAKIEECISQMNKYVEQHTAATTPEVVQSYKKIFTDRIKEMRGLQINNAANNNCAATIDEDVPF